MRKTPVLWHRVRAQSESLRNLLDPRVGAAGTIRDTTSARFYAPESANAPLRGLVHPRGRKADIKPFVLPVPRPCWHPGGLAAVQAPGSRDHSIMLCGPLQNRCDLFQHLSISMQHPVDQFDRWKCTTLVAVASCARQDQVR